MTPFECLREMARSWGGDIVETAGLSTSWPRRDLGPDVSECPFAGNLAVNWKKRLVLYEGSPNLGELVHEMGHVFAARKPPRESREWRFFGFEYLVAVRAGCRAEWLLASRDYGLTQCRGSAEFGDLTLERKRKLLASRLRFAKRNGLIKFGVPVSVRGRRKP